MHVAMGRQAVPARSAEGERVRIAKCHSPHRLPKVVLLIFRSSTEPDGEDDGGLGQVELTM
jgi:hypothetical protein